MIEQIKSSDAYNNIFFRRAPDLDALEPQQLHSLAVNWRAVTRSFWLASCRLIGLLSEEGQIDLLSPLLKIAAEDAGLGGGAVDGRRGPPHYLLWEKMCEPLKIDWNAPIAPETTELVSAFNAVDSLEDGLAMVIVVETVALNIVKAMLSVFIAAGFKEDDLDFLTLHCGLEVEHAQEMGEVAGMVRTDLARECARFCDKWGNFWEAMHLLTFRE